MTVRNAYPSVAKSQSLCGISGVRAVGTDTGLSNSPKSVSCRKFDKAVSVPSVTGHEVAAASKYAVRLERYHPSLSHVGQPAGNDARAPKIAGRFAKCLQGHEPPLANAAVGTAICTHDAPFARRALEAPPVSVTECKQHGRESETVYVVSTAADAPCHHVEAQHPMCRVHRRGGTTGRASFQTGRALAFEGVAVERRRGVAPSLAPAVPPVARGHWGSAPRVLILWPRDD